MDVVENKVRLPVIGQSNGNIGKMGGGKLQDIDMEAELKKFEQEEMATLGLETPKAHWIDEVPSTFTAKQRAHTTILVGGLTMAHDVFIEAGLRGLGYKVLALDVPDNNALTFGKEFGNRGQCNPTYFTVGNLVKFLTYLRDEKKISKADIVNNYLFVTAGACGPCRFGTYVTEYRKALRDSGFDGFRVMLFQQQGGLKQATGDDAGLEMNPKFFLKVILAVLAGDALNLLMYRTRPYEVEKGATDKAVAEAKVIIAASLRDNGNVLWAIVQARRIMARVEVDRSIVKPKVSVIGEFWAMTTEGDGNYGLQRFLEQEGAEVDIQPVTAWLLFMLWEQRWDTKERMYLRGEDKSKKGLVGVNPRKKLLMLWAGEKVVRGMFQTFANLVGVHDYHLPDMDLVAETAKPFYNNHLRGGEGHMEVGKLILNVQKKKATMTLSVKPFGCMPSSGVSDGVQSFVTEKFPGSIFCAIETNGDGAVNVYSRVQMMLFKARQAAKDEVARALSEAGMTMDDYKAKLADKASYARSTWYPGHFVASTAANTVHEVIRPSLATRVLARLGKLPSKLTVKSATELGKATITQLKTTAPEAVKSIARLAAF